MATLRRHNSLILSLWDRCLMKAGLSIERFSEVWRAVRIYRVFVTFPLLAPQRLKRLLYVITSAASCHAWICDLEHLAVDSSPKQEDRHCRAAKTLMLTFWWQKAALQACVKCILPELQGSHANASCILAVLLSKLSKEQYYCESQNLPSHNTKAIRVIANHIHEHNA